MRKTKLQIIEELFDNGYCKDPSTRSLNDSRGCLYENKEGNRCAVGKCLIDPVRIDRYFSTEDLDSSVDCIPNLEDELKEEYRGHGLGFWVKLQDLHDGTFYWTESGLSSVGEDRLTAIKQQYEND